MICDIVVCKWAICRFYVIRGSLPGGKMAWPWCWPSTPIQRRGERKCRAIPPHETSVKFVVCCRLNSSFNNTLLILRRLMSYIYIYIYMEHPFLMFLDHTQRHSTVGRTPLDEWSARCRDLYLTTHDTHNRQIFMPPVGFEPTISAGERQGIYQRLYPENFKDIIEKGNTRKKPLTLTIHTCFRSQG